jgi:hypothetical protein
MNPTATDDRTAAFVRLLQELGDRPPGTAGEWLARLVAEIRPRGRENLTAARERLRSVIGVLQAQPESAAALNAHLGALLTSRMHRILYAESGILTNPGFMSGLVRRLLGRLLPPAVNTEYLRDLVVEVFDHPEDHRWMFAVPREDWAALLDVILNGKPAPQPIPPIIDRTFTLDGTTILVNAASLVPRLNAEGETVEALFIDVTLTRGPITATHQFFFINPPVIPRSESGNERQDLIQAASEIIATLPVA